jgi:hypothetical protein
LKLADKTLVVGFIPILIVAFTLMPYVEVGKSRRYADRRVGLTVAALFFGFMLISNWMGSPEFRVETSPELEVAQEIMPQEGPNVLLGVPYEYLTLGTYLPGQEIAGNPYLTRALEEFGVAMQNHSCDLNGTNSMGITWDDKCVDNGEGGYRNNFANDALPDPYAELVISQQQSDMLKLTLNFIVEDPENPGEYLVNSRDQIYAFRHESSFYEEECRFFNKDC